MSWPNYARRLGCARSMVVVRNMEEEKKRQRPEKCCSQDRDSELQKWAQQRHTTRRGIKGGSL